MSPADYADSIQLRRAMRKARLKPVPAAHASTNHYNGWNPLYCERELELRAMAEAIAVLNNVLSTIKRRHSYTRHVELSNFVDSPSFHKLCVVADRKLTHFEVFC